MDKVEQWLTEQADVVASEYGSEKVRAAVLRVASRWTEAGVIPPAVSVDELAKQIAVGVHTGLRKGSEAPSSADLWNAISASSDSAWMDAATFCAEGLTSMGYVVRDEAS
jgi:hypothetical protein